jgi:hypothetical protein
MVPQELTAIPSKYDGKTVLIGVRYISEVNKTLSGLY